MKLIFYFFNILNILWQDRIYDICMHKKAKLFFVSVSQSFEFVNNKTRKSTNNWLNWRKYGSFLFYFSCKRLEFCRFRVKFLKLRVEVCKKSTAEFSRLYYSYSFWDWLRNFLQKFTWIVLSVLKLNKLGKFR